MPAPPPLPSAGLLLRIPAVFDDLAAEITGGFGGRPAIRLGKDYHLVPAGDPRALREAPGFRFVSWHLPLHHAWPCCPPRTGLFVEKAAQALARKFAPRQPQAALVGALRAGGGNSYYQRLASNLRGRLLQLLPGLPPLPDPARQDPELPSLFCLLGQEGLFCGLSSPRQANGFFPGGTRFIRQSDPAAVSRAGAKIAEALHYLALHRPPPAPGSRWLELGASPGGTTAELLDRGQLVTAVDRAPLDPRLAGRPGLRFARADVAGWRPPAGAVFDALLCDLNGDARDSIRHVARHARHLRPGGLVVFTLKLAGASTFAAIVSLQREVEDIAGTSGLALLARTHLTYNRREFTLFFER